MLVMAVPSEPRWEPTGKSLFFICLAVSLQEARCFERHQKIPKCDAECRRVQEEKEEARVHVELV